LEIQVKHSGCRFWYVHIGKKPITELYKVRGNIEYSIACAGRVEYLLEEDRLISPPGSY